MHQQNQEEMSNKAAVFKADNAGNVAKFKYAVLLKRKNATNASLANKGFTALNMMYESILECIDAADNTEGQTAVKNTAGMEKLRTVAAFWATTLTENSEVETFKRFLIGEEIHLSTDEQTVNVTQRTVQTQGSIHQIPELVGDRACSLPKSTPEFFGLKKENVTEWLMVVENKFVTSKIDDLNKVSTLLEFIKGDAGIMALSHIAKLGYDWTLFREHLINTHQPVNKQRKLKKEFKEWKQNGQNLCDYNKKFLMLTNRITGLSDEMILDYYIDNVNGKYGYVIDSVREAWRDLGKEMNVSQAMV